MLLACSAMILCFVAMSLLTLGVFIANGVPVVMAGAHAAFDGTVSLANWIMVWLFAPPLVDTDHAQIIEMQCVHDDLHRHRLSLDRLDCICPDAYVLCARYEVGPGKYRLIRGGDTSPKDLAQEIASIAAAKRKASCAAISVLAASYQSRSKDTFINITDSVREAAGTSGLFQENAPVTLHQFAATVPKLDGLVDGQWTFFGLEGFAAFSSEEASALLLSDIPDALQKASSPQN
jgi:hypothetical protein